MLLIIPLKTTLKFDLSPPFTTYLQSRYPHLVDSSTTQEALRQDILHIVSLRNCISSSFSISNDVIYINSHHGHELALSKNNALTDCMEYHACLLECEKRNVDFPSNCLLLHWKSAYFGDGKKKKNEKMMEMSKSGNLQFERVCVLFNIAALLSYQAFSYYNNAGDGGDKKEGRTKAIQTYQSAAAVLHYLITTMGYETNNKTSSSASSSSLAAATHGSNILKEEGLHLTPDLTEPSLSMLLHTMLAQGQALSYAHLSASSDNYSLLAKLAKQTATFYNVALQQSQNVQFTKMVSFVTTSWGCFLKLNSLYYHALVQYHLSQHALQKENKYGVEIGRLGYCIEICVQGIKFYRDSVDDDSTDTKTPSILLPQLAAVYNEIQILHDTAKERINVAIKDNDAIYYDVVPQRRELEDIVGVDLMSKHLSKDMGGRGLDERLFPEQLDRPIFLSLFA